MKMLNAYKSTWVEYVIASVMWILEFKKKWQFFLSNFKCYLREKSLTCRVMSGDERWRRVRGQVLPMCGHRSQSGVHVSSTCHCWSESHFRHPGDISTLWFNVNFPAMLALRVWAHCTADVTTYLFCLQLRCSHRAAGTGPDIQSPKWTPWCVESGKQSTDASTILAVQCIFLLSWKARNLTWLHTLYK